MWTYKFYVNFAGDGFLDDEVVYSGERRKTGMGFTEFYKEDSTWYVKRLSGSLRETYHVRVKWGEIWTLGAKRAWKIGERERR